MSALVRLFVPIFAVTILMSGCEGIFSDSISTENEYYFQVKLNIENPQKTYHLNDTIYFGFDVPDLLPDITTGDSITLENATFVFNGLINFIFQETDTLEFLDNNFELLLEDGILESIKVIDYTDRQYSFMIRYGKPLDRQRLRFAFVPKIPGYFAFEAVGEVYFGADRTDYDNFSMANSTGTIAHNFNLEDVNSDVFMQIPDSIRLNRAYMYTPQAIESKSFYFFKVIDN